MAEPPRRPDPIVYVLIGVGAMVALLCGTCTYKVAGHDLWAIVAGQRGPLTSSNNLGLIAITMIGWLPTLVGLAMVGFGVRALVRFGARKPSASDE